jgi:soluble lytic murein transglycosylase-like protein
MRFVITLTVALLAANTSFAISPEYIDKAFSEIAKEQGVDENLLRAICWVESRHKPHAYRHGDASRHDHAFGLCQVLYSTAQGLGLKDDKCARDFSDMLPGERNYTTCDLFGPRTNIRYAAILLKRHLKKYDNNEYKAVLSYNAGRYVVCKNGWLHVNQVQEDGSYKREKFKRCLKGGPINLYYGNRVTTALERDK